MRRYLHAMALLLITLAIFLCPAAICEETHLAVSAHASPGSMVLAQDAPILLLDEPTTYLDMSAATEFTRLLKTLVVERQKTVLAVLHDLNNAIAYADDLWILDQGKLIYAGATADCLKTELIEKTFDVRRAQSAERIFFY